MENVSFEIFQAFRVARLSESPPPKCYLVDNPEFCYPRYAKHPRAEKCQKCAITWWETRDK